MYDNYLYVCIFSMHLVVYTLLFIEICGKQAGSLCVELTIFYEQVVQTYGNFGVARELSLLAPQLAISFSLDCTILYHFDDRAHNIAQSEFGVPCKCVNTFGSPDTLSCL